MRLDDKTYKTIMDNSIIATVDVIFIKNENQILLWLRDNKPLKGIYYLPWWRIEKGETIMEALKRKMDAELWFDINENKLQFVKNYDDFFDESIFEWTTLQNISITYAYKLDDNEVENLKINDSQHSDLKFFDINDENLDDRIKLRVKILTELWII